MFFGLVIGLLIGIPVAFVMLGISLIVGFIGAGSGFFHMMIIRTFHVMADYILVAVPLFIFMGVMLQRSGAAEHLYSALHINLGGFRGGLAVTTILVCTLMAAATGIIGAPVVAMGLFALPAMIKRNYDKALSVGSVCAGGTLGILIPASILLASGYGNLNKETLQVGAYRTLIVSSMILLTIVGAFVFSGTFFMIGGAEIVTDLLLGLPLGRWGLLAVMLFAYFVLGVLMEWVGIIPILVPLFTPLAIELGFNPLWFAILCCVVMQTSFLTPPMAPAIFYIRGVAPKEVKFGQHIVRGVIPFIGLQLMAVILIIVFPQLALWLPSMMVK